MVELKDTIEKYCVGLLKGDILTVKFSNDSKETAIAWGENYFSYYRAKQNKGVLVLVYRRHIKNYERQFYDKPYQDTIIKSWFDLDEYFEYQDRVAAEIKAKYEVDKQNKTEELINKFSIFCEREEIKDECLKRSYYIPKSELKHRKIKHKKAQEKFY